MYCFLSIAADTLSFFLFGGQLVSHGILHSAELMLTQHCNVSEAAYRSGFSNLAYFRSAFRDEFGVSPSEYMNKVRD